jgi:tRNA threonylcarbamoyl adenosine modification protein YeaZ
VKLLAFDTATRATAVALYDSDTGPDSALEARDDPEPGQRPGHAGRLLALVAELVDQAGGWDQVARIAVGVGPGTFTGLRIGIATAHGLARGRRIELVGVSTLRALAFRAREAGEADAQPVLALIDARRGELFAAGWVAGSDPGADDAALEPCAIPPARLCERLVELGPAPLAVGEGALLHATLLRDAGAAVPNSDSDLHSVSAVAHGALGAELVAGAAALVQPEYMRLPDAELTRRAKA